MAGIQTAIADLPNPQLKKMLTAFAAQAGNSMNTMRDHVTAWLDAGMNRVRGDYKRRTQLWYFFIGLAIAELLHIDTLRLAEVLWQHPGPAKAIASPAGGTAGAAYTDLLALGLPICWTADRWAIWTSCNARGCVVQIFGRAITAGSTLFGTSFWYDALGSVLKLRSNGPPPAPVPVPSAPTSNGA